MPRGDQLSRQWRLLQLIERPAGITGSLPVAGMSTSSPAAGTVPPDQFAVFVQSVVVPCHVFACALMTLTIGTVVTRDLVRGRPESP